MWLDKLNEFCDATALNTGGAATYNIGNQIDLKVARDIGVAGHLYLVILARVGITVASSTGTVQFLLSSDSTGTLATNGTQTVHYRTAAFATSTSPIVPGTVLGIIGIPMEDPAYERYLGIQQVTASTAINAGAIDAFLTTDVSKWKAYFSEQL